MTALCERTERSGGGLRLSATFYYETEKRDMEVVKTTLVYQNLLVEQAGRLKKKAYPVIGSNPADCMAD